MNKNTLKDLTFLFVEDEETILKFTVRFLEKVVKKVYTALDGEQGVQQYLAHKDEIDIIVTDINMPVMNGLDMIEKIREVNKDVPIIITTAYNETDFLKRSVELNVSAYVLKPIDLEQLMNSLTKTAEPIILKRELEKVHTIVDKNEEFKKLKTIFNSQENMVSIIKDNKVIDANQKFYEFFEIKDLSELYINDVFNLFLEEPGLIVKDELRNSECWITYIKQLNEIDRIVKIKNNQGIVKIFSVYIEVYVKNENSHILTFSDITLLKEKVNLLEYQATHDSLTGTFNRNKFYEMFEKEIRRNKRYKHDLSIIILDIDHFKLINDNHGHQVGDEVLKAIPKILYTCIREHDTLARWGGEEFMILLPETNITNASIVAEKIRLKIENEKFTDKNLNVTSSFGVSTLKDHDSAENLINRADKALYQSKEAGRNKVSILD